MTGRAGRVVVIGAGLAGLAAAWRLSRLGFDVRVLYYDIVRLTEDQEDALGVRFALLPELLRTCDVVSLHVPLNTDTRGLMGAREFAMMKDTGILINTCRGPVVDENALYQALTTRQIAAAGLDVMVEEPPKVDHPLFKLDNVVITPHMAGPTWENWAKAFRNGFDNIERVAAVVGQNANAMNEMRGGLAAQTRTVEQMVREAARLSDMSVELGEVARRFRTR